LLKSLLIGDNAFIGVSHLSQVHARQKLHQLRLDTIVDVIGEAAASGATGYTFSVHPNNFRILTALEKTGKLKGLEIWPVLPYAAGYVRTINEKGMAGLISEVLSGLGFADKAKFLVSSGISAVTFDPARMLNTFVDMQLANILNLKKVSLRTVLLHEVITDLGISFQTRQLFNSYMRHIQDKYNATPGFVTRNFVRFVRYFQEASLSLKDTVIMTPFNSIGFQMNPSKEACERCLSDLTDGNVIAMSIMAGGYLTLDKAAQYLQALRGISGIVVGVSTKQHAQQTFTRFRNATTSSSAT
jgi:hypothetical protein